MIHSLIIAMINYKLLRDLMTFVLLYLYVTINRIYGDLSLWKAKYRNSIYVFTSPILAWLISLVNYHSHTYIVSSYLYASRMRRAVSCGRQDVKIPRRVAGRSTNSVVVVCASWCLVFYNRSTLYITKRATWQSVSYNIRIFDVWNLLFDIFNDFLNLYN